MSTRRTSVPAVTVLFLSLYAAIPPGGNTRSHIDGVDISRSVLRAGHAYEQAAGWWRRRPPLE